MRAREFVCGKCGGVVDLSRAVHEHGSGGVGVGSHFCLAAAEGQNPPSLLRFAVVKVVVGGGLREKAVEGVTVCGGVASYLKGRSYERVVDGNLLYVCC